MTITRHFRHIVLSVTLVLAMAAALGLSVPARAQALQGPFQAVPAMEQTLFGAVYTSEPLEARLARLEQTVFGETQQGFPEARMAALQQVLSSAPAMAPKPVAAAPAPSVPAPSVPAEESDYPAVSQMEQRVFNRTFENEDITRRLDRLERQVAGQPQQGPLVARVDALRTRLLGDMAPDPVYSPAMAPDPVYGPAAYDPYGAPQTPYQTQYSQPQYNGAPPGYNPYGPAAGTPAAPGAAYPPDPAAPVAPATAATMTRMQAADMEAALANVERDILKQTYPGEPASQRLSRLEGRIFNQPAPPGMSDEERLQRVMAVADANGEKPPILSSRKSTMIQTVLPLLIFLVPLLL